MGTEEIASIMGTEGGRHSLVFQVGKEGVSWQACGCLLG